jgi:hypothetical protein
LTSVLAQQHSLAPVALAAKEGDVLWWRDCGTAAGILAVHEHWLGGPTDEGWTARHGWDRQSASAVLGHARLGGDQRGKTEER